MKKALLKGSLKVLHTVFDLFSGEIVVRGDVDFEGRKFRNLAILNITFQFTKDEFMADDNYTELIPNLKAVRLFRSILEKSLFELIDDKKVPDLIRQAAERYIQDLHDFSNAEILIADVKKAVGQLNPKQPGIEALAKNLLKAMGEDSSLDTSLSVEL
jgi:hypothetical protein